MSKYSRGMAMWLACVLAVSCGAVQQGNRMEVQQLEEAAEKWLSQQVHVTGRFASASADRVRLANSEIDFRLDRASRRIHSGTKRLEMVGTLSQRGNDLIFNVTSMRELPSEAKEFRERRERIGQGQFEELYELAQWARERGQWYDDRALEKLAHEADLQAFDWEVDRAEQRNNVKEMLALADRAEEMERPEAEVLQIRHRALWVARRTLPKDDPEATEDLATRVARLLPETDKELTPQQFSSQEKYLQDPVATYAEADPEQIPQLHRVLWVDLMAQAMELYAASGTPPGELAMRTQRFLPELPDLWRRFRLEELDLQAAQPGRLTRGKMIAVRDGYRELELPEKAADVVDRWLAVQRVALPGDDADAHLQLASDFRALVGDEVAAAELYQQALSISPDLPEAREGLRAIGYDYIDGRWQLVSEIDSAAMREERQERRGELGVGDSENEVLRRFPSPDLVARTVSGTSIIEQWIYDGPPSFYIYLRRDLTSQRARVIATHGAPTSR